MFCFTTPTQIRKLADRYKNIILSSQWSPLISFFTYFLLGEKSVSDFARHNPGSKSVSTLSRFIEDFDGNRWMRRLRESVLKKYLKKYKELDLNNFCFAIDDTNNPKFGKSYRTGSWHGSKGLYNGQRIVVLALVDMVRDFAIPLGFKFATKKGISDYVPCYDFCLELLEEVKNSGFPLLQTVFDSWFDSSDFITKVRSLGFQVVWEMKSSRTAQVNPNPFSRWIKITTAFKNMTRYRLRSNLESKAIKNYKRKAPCGSMRKLKIKGLSQQINCVAMFNRHNGRTAFGYWCATDLALQADNIWMLSRARWRIEKLFREVKQLLSFGRLPSGSKEAAELSVCLPFILYTSLLLEPELWGRQEDQTIGDVIQSIRNQLLMSSISKLVHDKSDAIKIRLLARIRKDRVNKKPVNQTADGRGGTLHLERRAL